MGDAEVLESVYGTPRQINLTWQARPSVASSKLWTAVRRWKVLPMLVKILTLAGAAGFEPATPGFGDLCSTN